MYMASYVTFQNIDIPSQRFVISGYFSMFWRARRHGL